MHGPCQIGKSCFIGFGAVVFDCNIGTDTVILHRSIIRGVEISSDKVVPDGAIITSPEAASALEDLTKIWQSLKNRLSDQISTWLKGTKTCKKNLEAKLFF